MSRMFFSVFFLEVYHAQSTSTTTTSMTTTTEYSTKLISSPPPTVTPNGFNPLFGDVFVVQTEYLSVEFKNYNFQ